MLEQVISNKTSWTRVAFGDVVRKVSDKVDPWESGLERYVAGDHMDTDDLRIRRWGLIGEDYLGPAFHMRFKPGHVLYGSRRTYLRKVALADFEGITANTTYVLETKDPNVLMPELLPFIMQTEAFHAHSIARSKGSVNPYINFSDAACFEFSLPPIQEQARLVEALTSANAAAEELLEVGEKGRKLFLSLLREMVNRLSDSAMVKISDVCSPDSPLCYGVVQPGDETPNGVPLIRVCDIENDEISRDSLKRISPDIDANYKRSRVAEGDVLVSIVGTIGRVLVATEEDTDSNIARAIARIRPKDDLLSCFLAYVLKSPDYQDNLVNEAFESARKTLNLNALGALRVPLPDLETQHAWCARLKMIEDERSRVRDRHKELKRISSRIIDGEGWSC